MAVKIKFNAQRASQEVIRSFNKVRSNKQMLNEVGTFVVDRVKKETRKGRPYNKARSLPALKESTKRIRQGLAKINTTHPAFQNKKSNLTFTGQLIDGIGFVIKNTMILISVSGRRKRIKTFKSLKKNPQILDNAELIKDLDSRGFKLFEKGGFDTDPNIDKRINNIVRRVLRRALQVLNNTR